MPNRSKIQHLKSAQRVFLEISEDSKTRAKQLLAHYFTYTWNELNLKFSGDNHADIDSIVETIINAAYWRIIANQTIKEINERNKKEANPRALPKLLAACRAWAFSTMWTEREPTPLETQLLEQTLAAIADATGEKEGSNE